jgi:SET domain-containing protein
VIWRPDPQFDLVISFTRYRQAPPYLKALLDRYAYPSVDRPGQLIYETDNGRFMNHSEWPNTDFSQVGCGISIADINEGDELTCNYHQFFGEHLGALPELAMSEQGTSR